MSDDEITIETLYLFDSSISPEANLWHAVLQRALLDYLYIFTHSFYTFEQYTDAKLAFNWFISNDVDIGTFLWCCEYLYNDIELYKYIIKDRFIDHYGDPTKYLSITRSSKLKKRYYCKDDYLIFDID